MNRNLGIKLAIILATLLVFTVGIFLGGPDNWKKSAQTIREKGVLAGVQQNIHLGLDLQGGTHLILQVMVNDAVNAETDRAAERLKQQFHDRGVTFTEVSKPADKPEEIDVRGVPADQVGTAREIMGDQLAEYDLASGADNSFTLAMKPMVVRDLKTRAVTQSIETIRQRVDALGVTEPIIQEHGLGENQIMVQLPGLDDPARIRDMIQSTALLEIKQVFGGPFPTEQEALGSMGLATDRMVLKGASIGAKQAESEGYFVVSRASVVAGRDIRDAQVTRSADTNRPQVNFHLTVEAGKRFGQFTGSNIGNPLSVVLDKKIIEVATIQSQIHDDGVITGGFTDQSASDLALKLRSGALPAGIRYLEDRTVGASLGADSIKQGVTAAVIGMALVMIFMLIYYHGAGINANLGLILNLVILLGFLGYSGATLTLPGIAGVILTIGMGVDSNVLIFERIREEMRSGKPASTSVDHGFGRAWLTIIDTHITTIVSALILFLFGTGPVRGFAITLAFGLFANLFTAVFVSRVIFDKILEGKQRGEALSI